MPKRGLQWRKACSRGGPSRRVTASPKGREICEIETSKIVIVLEAPSPVRYGG